MSKQNEQGSAKHGESRPAGGSSRAADDARPVRSGGTAPAGSQPGVLGDETEEQNLGQPGNPSARITREEVEEAFRREERGGSSGTGSDAGSARRDREPPAR